jgi:predicted metal-dependent hydrolase
VLKNWLMAQAREYLPQRTRALADHLQLGHKLSEVVFRKTRSKWGHCTAKGRIQYNWLIMLAPDGVIDYMICHEVCHLLHMNHSKKYWQAVASVCPDYKRYVGWLKRHEHRLFF